MQDMRDLDSIHGVGKTPWRRAWQPIPIFVPEESHGQRSLVGYNKECLGRKEGEESGINMQNNDPISRPINKRDFERKIFDIKIFYRREGN